MKRKWYEWFLTIVYFAMVGLCVYLNFTPGHKESTESIAVNGIMFVIVAIVFLSSDFGSFFPMNSIIKDLKSATEKIRQDAMNSHAYLWEPYQSSNIKLFKNEKLTSLFQDFIFELNRAEDAQNAYYRANIDDYINEDLVDKTMHRNELNQIPGMLTGLGILGTFIGLSLGLQSFNTGTTAQMTESIEPLMNGIKVAFHTSIYGMIFSLTYNAIYKKKLFEAEEAVDNFVGAFKKYVLPDSENNGMNQIISLQKEQLSAINNMYSSIADEMARIINPQYERVVRALNEFQTVTVRNETEAVKKIVEIFIDEMNKSLDESFERISQAVGAQYQSQQQNAALMQQVLKETGSNAVNLNGINQETSRLIDTLNHYSESIQAIQNKLQDTLSSLRTQDNASHDLLIQEKNMLMEQANLVTGFRAAITEMVAYSKDTNERTNDAVNEMTNGIDYIKREIDRQSRKMDI